MILIRFTLSIWQFIGKCQIGFCLAIYWLLELALLPIAPFLPKVVNIEAFITSTFSEVVKMVEHRHLINGKF